MEGWKLFIGESVRYERTCLNLPPGAQRAEVKVKLETTAP